jgi:hypothetical protein
LAANSRPEWLFTITGCRHLYAEQADTFDTVMNGELNGCARQELPAAWIFRCGNHGSYIYFFDKDRCEEAVAKYRRGHQT